MAGSGFAVTVKLIDFATGPLGKVNSAIANVEKTAKKAAREGGLFEARDALKKMRDEAGEVAEKLGQVFTPLGGLTAAGSLAGLVGLAERFARTGNEVSRTANLYGVAAKDLQNWRGAMRLAGGDASNATALIGNVGRQLYLARAGLNPTIARGAAQFGLDITKPDLQFVLDAADKLKGLSAQQRRQFAEVFGIDEGSLALLSRGRDAVAALIQESERHGYLNDEQLRQAAELHHAYGGLQLSIESMGSAIGAQESTWMTPMLKSWSEWIDKARETPAVMKNVELGVNALAIVIGVTAVGAIGKLMLKMLAFNAAWATSPLGAVAMGAWAGYELTKNMELPTPEVGKARSDYDKRKYGPYVHVPGSVDWFKKTWDRLRGEYHPDNAGSEGEYGVGQGSSDQQSAPTPAARPPGGAGTKPLVPPKPTTGGAGPGTRDILRDHGQMGGGYNLGQMKTLALNAGFKGQDADTMAALAMVESSGNPNARGKAGELGLTQINPNAWGDDLAQQALDPQRAFEIAHGIYGKQGWAAWKNSIPGAQAYLNRGNIPAEPVPEGGKPGTVGQFFSRLFGIGSAQAAPMMVPPAAGIIDKTGELGVGNSWGKMDSVAGMIVHHTGGRGTVGDVENVFRQRSLGSQFVIDRDGRIYQTLPDGARGRHIMPGWGEKGAGLSNANMEGVEIIAKNDRDVTPAEVAAANRLIYERSQRFGYDPSKSVFGHGEVNPGHKDPEEGMTVVRGVRAGAYGPPVAPGAQPDKAQPYGPPVATAADSLGKAADAESGDTSHHVQVTFANAPPGMRSGLTRADGPASVSVRTAHAMDGVY